MTVRTPYVPVTAGIAYGQAAIGSSPQAPDSVAPPAGGTEPAQVATADAAETIVAGSAETVGAAETDVAKTGNTETVGAAGSAETIGAGGTAAWAQHTDRRQAPAPHADDSASRADAGLSARNSRSSATARDTGRSTSTRNAGDATAARDAGVSAAERNTGDTTATRRAGDTGTLHTADKATAARNSNDSTSARNAGVTDIDRKAGDMEKTRNSNDSASARQAGVATAGREAGNPSATHPADTGTAASVSPEANRPAAITDRSQGSAQTSRFVATPLAPAAEPGKEVHETARTAAIRAAGTAPAALRPRTTAGGDSDPLADSATTACALCGTADSLLAPQPVLLATTEATERSSYRDTTAQAVFGAESVVLVPDRLPAAQPAPLTDNAVFQGFVLLLAATYAMLLYRNPGDVRSLLSRITRDTIAGKRLSEESPGSGFPRFLNLATGIGMLFMGVAIVKYGDWLMPRTPNNALSHGAVLGLSPVATLITALLALYQWIVVRTAGAVTLTQPFITRLVLLKRTYFSLAVIAASPALLLFALSSRGEGHLWSALVAGILCLTAACYLWETLRLFLSKKISILHWFLYLCAVEIFPVSLLWLLAAR